ncbi:MAG TPA: transposase [Steroidobacteraceae bacterium]|jgi:putative transposase
MKKSRFSEEKIIAILKQLGAGAKATELARKHGVSDATIYHWKARYGGMEVSHLRRLKELESENARLKRMYADLSLTHHALQDAVNKSCNGLHPQ